jgi:hypothetical protein
VFAAAAVVARAMLSIFLTVWLRQTGIISATRGFVRPEKPLTFSARLTGEARLLGG